MKKIVSNHPDVTCWVIEQAEVYSCGPSDATSIGVLDDDKIVGGVIFHNYTGRDGSVTIHSAGVGTNWPTREFLWAIFDYPFNVLGVRKIIGPVPSTNGRAIGLNTRLGFKIEAAIRDAFQDGDLVLMTIVRADCRWLRYCPRTIQPGLGNIPMLVPAS